MGQKVRKYKIILTIILGIAISLVVYGCLLIIELVIMGNKNGFTFHGEFGELINENAIMPIWNYTGFACICLIFVVLGLIIRITYVKKKNSKIKKQAKAALEEKQRQEWEANFQHKLNMTKGQCELNKGEGAKITVEPGYKCVSIQEKLWNAINEISIPLKELDDIVAEYAEGIK